MTDDGIDEITRREVLGVLEQRGLLWQEIPDHLWKHSRVREMVAEYHDGNRDESTELLLDEIADAIETNHGYIIEAKTIPKSPGRTPGIRTPPVLEETKQEIACRDAVSEYLGQIVSKRRDVQHFRNSLPGNKLFSAGEDIRQLLCSPIAQYLSFDQMFVWGIDPLTAHLKSAEHKVKVIAAEVTIPQGTGFLINQDAARALNALVTSTLTVIGIDGQTITHSIENPLSDFMIFGEGDTGRFHVFSRYDYPLHFPAKNGSLRVIQGFRRSAVGEALSLAHRLSKDMNWDCWQALVFLCTGVIDNVATVNALLPSIQLPSAAERVWAEANITSQPWASLDSLKRLHDVMRTRTGANQTLPKFEHIEMFRFVNNLLNGEDSEECYTVSSKTGNLRPDWPRLQEAWKIEHIDKRTPRNFQRDYHMTKKALLPPKANEFNLLSEDP